MQLRKRLGWLKLHRKIINWEWFNDDNMVRVFLFLLITANTRQTKFDGIAIQRGQVAISIDMLCTALGMSTQKVRTCLKRLRLTNEITTVVTRGLTNRFTLVTITKFDDYQETDKAHQQRKQQALQQTKPHFHLNNKNNKENLIEEVEKESAPSPDFEEFLIEKLLADAQWKEGVAKSFGLDETGLIRRLDEFFASNRNRGKLHSDLPDLKSHFVDWLKIILNPKNKNRNNNENNGPTGTDRRRGMEAGFHTPEEYGGSF